MRLVLLAGSFKNRSVFCHGRSSPRWSVIVCASLVLLEVKNPPANAGDAIGTGSIPVSGRSPGEGNGNPLQYSCLENSHGQRSLVGYSPWGCRVRCNWTCPSSQHMSLKRKYILFSAVLSQSCPTLCNPMDCSPPWRFSRQEYWSGLPCPPLGDLPNPGTEPRPPALQADSLPLSREALFYMML